MLFTLNISFKVSADEINNNELGEFHFLSEEIPLEATEYARNYFALLSVDELLACGFSYDEIVNLQIEPGFTAYEYDKCDNLYYYFPVTDNKNIIAMLTVIDLGNNKFSGQFGKSFFANSINKLTSDFNNPYIFVITNNAMYALDNKNNFTSVDFYYYAYDQDENAEEIHNPNLTFAEAYEKTTRM